MDFSLEDDNRNFRIPMVTELLGNKNVASFAEYPPLLQVPFVEALKTARPSAIILLTGKVFSGLVTSVCERNNEYRYYCDPTDALNYIQSVAQEGDVQYAHFIYFLVASYQNLNPNMMYLTERECTITKYLKNKGVEDRFFTMK